VAVIGYAVRVDQLDRWEKGAFISLADATAAGLEIARLVALKALEPLDDGT